MEGETPVLWISSRMPAASAKPSRSDTRKVKTGLELANATAVTIDTAAAGIATQADMEQAQSDIADIKGFIGYNSNHIFEHKFSNISVAVNYKTNCHGTFFGEDPEGGRVAPSITINDEWKGEKDYTFDTTQEEFETEK